MKKVELHDGLLSVTDGRSGRTGSVSLGSIRYAYLFLPGSFKWALLLTSRTEFKYIDIAKLDEEPAADLFTLMAQQPESSWRSFEFVISDFSGVTVSFDFADSAGSDADVIRAITASRAVRDSGLGAWLAGAPSITRGSVTFRPDGAALVSGTIPWNSLDRIEVAHVDQPIGGGMYIHFVPSRESGLRRKFIRIGSAELHEFYAELDFWRSRFSARSAEGSSSATDTAVRPRKAITCLVVAAITVIVVVVILLLASRIEGRRARADSGMIPSRGPLDSVSAVLTESTESSPSALDSTLPPAASIAC